MEALKTIMEGEDAAAIKTATEELAKASHKLAEQLYQQQGGAAGAQPGAAGSPGATDAQGSYGGQDKGDDVMDADFTEVK